jgi:hypothetical protein
VYNLVTVKWGTKYTSDDVNKLYDPTYNCYCMTDDATGLNPNIKIIDCEHDLDGFWNKVSLFQGGLFTGKTIYLDLDIVIQNDISLLLNQSSFTVVKCYWKPLKEIPQRKNHIHHNINSSVMVWNEDENIDIWNKFIEDPEYYMLKYRGNDDFMWWEGFTFQYWPKDLIYSRLYGINADSWYNPGTNWYLPEAKICLMNGETTKQDYISLEKDINKYYN